MKRKTNAKATDETVLPIVCESDRPVLLTPQEKAAISRYITERIRSIVGACRMKDFVLVIKSESRGLGSSHMISAELEKGELREGLRLILTGTRKIPFSKTKYRVTELSDSSGREEAGLEERLRGHIRNAKPPARGEFRLEMQTEAERAVFTITARRDIGAEQLKSLQLLLNRLTAAPDTALGIEHGSFLRLAESKHSVKLRLIIEFCRDRENIEQAACLLCERLSEILSKADRREKTK